MRHSEVRTRSSRARLSIRATSGATVGLRLLTPLLVFLLAGCGPDRASVDWVDGPSATQASGATSTPVPAGSTDVTVTPLDIGRIGWHRLATGIRMRYVSVESARRNASTVIFLHGYTDSMRSFGPTIRALHGRTPTTRLYALDLRGHGASSMPPADECAEDPSHCFELEDFSADLEAFMSAEGIRSAYLVGHSLGTLIAQDFALAHPERVDGLVLIGATARSAGNPVLRDFVLEGTLEGEQHGIWQHALERRPDFGTWPASAYVLTPRDADPNAETWAAAAWVADPTADPDFLARIVPETASVRIGTWLGVVRMLLVADLRRRLAHLETRVLILWASQDVVFPQADQVALRAALDAAALACGASYVWKEYGRGRITTSGPQPPDLGHNTQWGAPDAVATDIHAFLTTGAPTTDRYYADPADPTSILTERGSARLLVREAATDCS